MLNEAVSSKISCLVSTFNEYSDQEYVECVRLYTLNSVGWVDLNR